MVTSLLSARGIRLAGLFLLLLIPICHARADQKRDVWIEVRTTHFLVASNGNEKDAQRVAEQFELVRDVFQTILGFKRVDPPQPIRILALKNESSLSKLFPDYWAQKGHTRPAGLFQATQDANYILVRMDAEGDYRYHILYHEYTHAIVRLNFNYLPPWLNEGFAEVIGNARFQERTIEIGQPSPEDLQLLSETKLLPLDQLFQVTERSNYYNEQNLANIFYAESWALVHYLMLDPIRRKGRPLDHYVQMLSKGLNALDAAKAAFGDLGQLQADLQKYVTQLSFYEIKVKPEAQTASVQMQTRVMQWGEVEALEGEVEFARGKTDLAVPLLEAAVKDDPQLASPFVTLGMARLAAGDRDAAMDNFGKAISLDTANYLAYFYRATLSMSPNLMAGDNSQVVSDLEKTVALSPQFAPAYSLLAVIYERQPETRDKALASAQEAAQLDPGNFTYQINLGFLLANRDRLEEARALAQRLDVAAKNDNERDAVQNLDATIARRAAYDQRIKNSPALQSDTAQNGAQAPGGDVQLHYRESDAPTTSDAAQPLQNTGAFAIGIVASTQCTGSEMLLELNVLGLHFRYHSADTSKILFLDAQGNPANARPGCSTLRGQRIKLGYQPLQGKDWDGEVLTIRQVK
jgi:tetratricopeptide (TPR) repeat protein